MDRFCCVLPFVFFVAFLSGFKYSEVGFLVFEVILLKVLIVYDSVSVNRNTEKVAEAIRATLKSKGLDVQSV